MRNVLFRTWAANISSAFSVQGHYDSSQVEIVGDWAIERYSGRLSLAPRDGGETIHEVVRGIHIYRRQPDGTWRIAQDVWNSEPAPPR